MSEELIGYYKLEGLYHLTHVDHIRNIFRYGLLPHNDAHKYGLVRHDISSTDVQNLRSHRHIGGRSVHDYVPLYFNPKNAMLYQVSQVFTPNDIVVIRLSCNLMLQKGVWFTDGNAANATTLSYDCLEDLDKLDWECIRAGYWTEYVDGRRKRMAEILVPNKISDNYIKRKSHIYVRNQDTKSRILGVIPYARVTIDKGFYFS